MSRWKVRDVMTAKVAWVGERAPYREIVDLLAARGVGAVPVLDDAQHVAGLVSESDLLYKVELTGWPHEPRLFEPRRSRVAHDKAAAALARDLMTSPAITIMPNTPVRSAARILDQENVKRLPVVDDLGRLVGIVSRRDLLSVFLQPDQAVRDEVIDQAFRDALHTGPPQVDVTVRDGVVELHGELERSSMIPVAVRLAFGVDGVVEVRNHLSYQDEDLGAGSYLATP